MSGYLPCNVCSCSGQILKQRSAPATCNSCFGQGVKYGTNSKCYTCSGRGTVNTHVLYYDICNKCSGKGFLRY